MKPVGQVIEDGAAQPLVHGENPPRFLVDPHPLDGDALLRSQAAREHLKSYRALVARTIDVFGDQIKASLWLSSPSPDFGGKAPLQIAQMVDYSPAEIDRLFEPVFVRIEEGIYW